MSNTPQQRLEMHSSRRDVLKTLASMLSLPVFPRMCTSAETPATNNIEIHSAERIASHIIKSTICLNLDREGSISLGSATLVQTPTQLQKILYPDEVLAISVSHNFRDWSEQSSVSATRFTSFDADFHGTNPERYKVRLLSRFTHPSRHEISLDGAHKQDSTHVADLSLLAVQIPVSGMNVMTPNLIPLAPSDYNFSLGDEIIAAGFGDHSTNPSSRGGYPKKDSPVDQHQPALFWRTGKVIKTNDTTSITQFGNVKNKDIITTVPNIPGDSGGGIFVWNQARARVELVGVCNAGSKVSLGQTDFDDIIPELPKLVGIFGEGNIAGLPADAIIVRSEKEFLAISERLRRDKAGFALDTPWRGIFEHVEGVHSLIVLTGQKYDQLLVERAQLADASARLSEHIAKRTLLPGVEDSMVRDLRVLTAQALKSIDAEIFHFKPHR